MENESLTQACLQALSQVVALAWVGAESGDGQTWLCVADTSVRIGLAESPDGQAIALLVCSGDEPCELPPDISMGAIEPSDTVPADGSAAPGEPEMATDDWWFVSDGAFGLHVKGGTGEAVAIKRLTRADLALPDAATALGEWFARAVFALG